MRCRLTETMRSREREREREDGSDIEEWVTRLPLCGLSCHKLSLCRWATVAQRQREVQCWLMNGDKGEWCQTSDSTFNCPRSTGRERERERQCLLDPEMIHLDPADCFSFYPHPSDMQMEGTFTFPATRKVITSAKQTNKWAAEQQEQFSRFSSVFARNFAHSQLDA